MRLLAALVAVALAATVRAQDASGSGSSSVTLLDLATAASSSSGSTSADVETPTPTPTPTASYGADDCEVCCVDDTSTYASFGDVNLQLSCCEQEQPRNLFGTVHGECSGLPCCTYGASTRLFRVGLNGVGPSD